MHKSARESGCALNAWTRDDNRTKEPEFTDANLASVDKLDSETCRLRVVVSRPPSRRSQKEKRGIDQSEKAAQNQNELRANRLTFFDSRATPRNGDPGILSILAPSPTRANLSAANQASAHQAAHFVSRRRQHEPSLPVAGSATYLRVPTPDRRIPPGAPAD